MDGQEGSERVLAVQISLDSVVQKASSLEGILRSCKARVCEETGGGDDGGVAGVGWGREEAESWSTSTANPQEHYTSRNFAPSSPSLSISCPPPSPATSSIGQNNTLSAAATAEAWQQLTSYIVGLEKEVQHYRKLVEELQAREVYSQQLAGFLPQLPQGMPFSPIPESNGTRGDEQVESPYVGALFGGGVKVASQRPAPAVGIRRESKQWDQLMEDPDCCSLLLVFSYLTTVELCAISRVCRRWYLISKHPLLWRSIQITETNLPPQALSYISQRCSGTEKITLHGLIPEMAICEEDLQSYIQRMKGSLEGELASLLAVCGRNLLSLTITECNLMITERALWLVSMHCPNLEEFSYSSDEFPPSSESIWSLSNGCKNIRHLTFHPLTGSPQAERFNDDCLQIIARGWPQLKHISVGGKAISANGVAEIALCCPQLKYIELLHGPHLNSKAVTVLCQEGALRSLETLSLPFTPISPKALLQIIIHCVRLTSLELHVSLHTYFPGAGEEPAQITKYERILHNLKELQHQQCTRGVIHLYEYNA